MTVSRIHSTSATPIPAWAWGAELLVLAAIAVSTTNLLLLAVMWVCLVATLAMLGNRPGAFAMAQRLSGVVCVWWIIMAIVSPSADPTLGSVMWRLPTWNPGPGVRLGGVMTASGLLLTATSSRPGCDRGRRHISSATSRCISCGTSPVGLVVSCPGTLRCPTCRLGSPRCLRVDASCRDRRNDP